ncbi:hypothetical protein KHC33_00785 [Methanospirillum sp. J.3.6.1-F.2.7.3]|jgi:energy-coupling factor transport system permease protein|uniref:Uncharacterized protein n=2 Tax=Methanospirillum TaxID=2202 RepID=A0A8E7B259_9EURY|nr:MULTISPECIES: hypothetical protein [Methanospirillum]MDX8551733.1 hypothetical protein [Methanospirillum hungatei]QVV89103.1 hypothetical protein KHC33_00785 [Methanospirillum sp. J.3.6.1-F.2.7.3]QXO93597.1 hypothetical protein KSK55_09425 [Methanospirillum hungatei]
MQDPRIRLLATVILSAAAWVSLAGAILSLIWWMIFGKAQTSIRTIRSLILILLVPVVMGLAAIWSGEDGFSYIIRITAILIIASWMYAGRYPGELLDVGVWLFGNKTGFDLGLIGELSMSSLEVLARETNRVSVAIRQKGKRLSPTMIPAVFSGVVIRQLQLAQERAVVLTLRGYTSGGTHCPVFVSPLKDRIAGAFCCAVLLFSLIAGDFFIISGSTFIV